ncbi:hypothetical protein JMJ77_0009195, partial [Colletotrichum scovillei]
TFTRFHCVVRTWHSGPPVHLIGLKTVRSVAHSFAQPMITCEELK